MQANPRNLIGLFDQTLRYLVPIFQRHYVWNEKDQWIPLWEDILEKHAQRIKKQETAPHFFGAIILDTVRKQSTKEVSRFVVIDGQQRITTIQLLLASLRNYANEKGFHSLSNAIHRALLNPDPDFMENSDEEIYKLWPTEFNRKVFCDILNSGSYEKVNEAYPVIRLPRKRKPEPRDRLIEAYVFFYTRIDNLCKGYADQFTGEYILQELYGVLKDDFSVVEIILSGQDDPQQIFTSLNAHGKPLSQSDLLRSSIFMRAEKSHEERDRLYKEYWSLFEDGFWDAQTRRGNLSLSRLDLITRIFLSSKIGMAVDAKEVHLEYKNWIQQKKPFMTVEDELESFTIYAKRFRYFEEPEGNEKFDNFARRLKIWDVKTIYSLVIFLWEETDIDDTELLACYRTLEDFIVRRLICQKDNKEYNKYFVEVVSRLRNEEPSSLVLKRILATGSGTTREWPNNQEFERHWCSTPIYGSLNSMQITTILKMIDNQIRSTKTENVIQSSLSVEHIMPQSWAENYPLDGKKISKEMSRNWFYSLDEEENKFWSQIKDKVQSRNRAIDTFGNLTLVTQPLNSAMRNADFKEKKEELRNSVLLLNRYFDEIQDWDEIAIDKRARKLYDTAKVIWFGP